MHLNQIPILLSLLYACFSGSTNPVWTQSNLIQCDTFVLSQFSSTKNYDYQIQHAYTSGSNVFSILSISNWEVKPSATNVLRFTLQNLSSTITIVRMTAKIQSSGYITSLRVGILIYSKQEFNLINVGSLTISTFVNISVGTGSRYAVGTIDYITPIDLTHVNYIIPFLSSMYLSSSSGNFLALKLTLQIVNQTHYSYNFSTNGDVKVNSASFFRMIYDQTLVQQTKFSFLDVAFLIGINKVSVNTVTFKYSHPKNFISGLNTYNFSLTNNMQFDFTEVFLLTSLNGYNNINITCWNYRHRSCPDPYVFYLQSQTKCYDVCPTQYYGNSTFNFCQSCHYTCLTCNSSLNNTCTSCNTLTALRFLNGSYYCLCKDGYYDSGQVNCVACNVSCITCNNNSTCLSCNISGNMILSGSYCICVTSSALLPSKSQCILCSSISFGCLSCSTSACTVCDTSLNLTRNGSICSCPVNQFLNSLQQCQLCNLNMINCITCKNQSFCNICKSPFIIINGTCVCSNGTFYNSTSNTCIACLQNCLLCTNQSFCQQCQINKTFTLIKGVCCQSIFWSNDDSIPCTVKQCLKGYYNDSGICKQICGDGILFELQCDDGNFENKDGCSSKCTIETNYTCINGSSTTPSLCSYNKPLELVLESSTKDIKSNTILFKIEVGPALKVLDTFNFSSIMSSNIPNAQISFVYSNGSLQVSVHYNQSLQQKTVQISLQPPIIHNNTFAMKLSSSKFRIVPSNGQAYYFPDSFYNQNSILDYILIACTIASLILCLVFTRKLIGLQLISVLQMSFLTLSLCKKLHPIFVMWGRRGQFTNGYNQLQDEINNLFTKFITEQNIQNILFKGQFLQNYNWMLVIQIGIFLIGVFIFIINLLTKIQFVYKMAIFILKDMLMTFILFNTLNSAFSFGLHIDSMTKTTFASSEIGIDFVAIVISLGFNSAVLFVYFRHTGIFQDQLKLLKYNKSSTIHPFVFCIFRFVIGFLMGLFSSYSFCLLLIFSLQLGYLIYISINKSFKSQYQFARGVLNGVSICSHLLSLIIYEYAFTTQYSKTHRMAPSIAWIDVIIIVGATCFSIFCWIHNIFFSSSVEIKISNISNQTVENIRVKDIIETIEQIKDQDNLEQFQSTAQKNNKQDIIFATTQSKRRIIDSDQGSQSKQSSL